jgi:hypothetical protein
MFDPNHPSAGLAIRQSMRMGTLHYDSNWRYGQTC